MAAKLRVTSVRLGLFLGAVLTAAASIPFSPVHADSAQWHQNVSSMKGDELVSRPDGGVSVTNCSHNNTPPNVKNFNAAGAAQSTVNAQGFYACGEQRAVGQDGTVYGVRPSGTYGTDVVAYKNSTKVWSRHFTGNDPNCHDSQMSVHNIVVGPGGTLYLAVNENNPQCNEYGYIAAVKPSGGQLFLKRLADSSRAVSWLGVYQNGVAVLQNLSTTVRYFDLQGHAGASIHVDTPAGDHSGLTPPALDTDGAIYFGVNQDFPSNDQCRNNIITTKVLAYSAKGQRLGAYQMPACTFANSLRAGPWGAVFIAHSGQSGAADKVVTLGKKGTALSNTSLPMAAGDDTFYDDSPEVIGDTNGHVVLRRWYHAKLPDGTAAPPNTRVSLIDPRSGAVTSTFDSKILTSDAKVGFKATQWALANGHVYLLGQTCHDYGCVYDPPYDLYAVPTSGLGMDYPRGNLLAPSTTPPKKLRYIALGDSFSSGEGIEPFDSDSNIASGTHKNGCHRSDGAYGRQLAQDPAYKKSMQLIKFAPCSGATTNEILHTWPKSRDNQSEEPQISWLHKNKDTAIVTITIGGNDVDFNSFARSCTVASCLAYEPLVTHKINDTLPQRLNNTYAAIKSNSQRAHVYVLGYPHLLPDKLSLINSCRFKKLDRQSTRRVVSKLDRQIQQAVQRAGSRFTFVDPTAADSPFTGHELCKDKPYFNGFMVPSAYSYHPNYLGQSAYKKLLAAALQKNKQ